MNDQRRQTMSRLIFTIAAAQEESITTDCARADAVVALEEAMARVAAISPTIAHQVYRTERAK